MDNYLTFMNEFDRLKDMFGVTLVEAKKDEEKKTDADSETEPEESEPEQDTDSDSTEESGEAESGKDENEGDGDGEVSDPGLDEFTEELDGGETDGGEAPASADEVNASPDTGDKDGVNGIDVEELHKELTDGDDNIYTRVARVAKKNPGAKMRGSEIEKVVATGIKVFMKNRGYGVITGSDPKVSPDTLMDGLVKRISKEIADLADPNAKKKAEQASKNESVCYYKRTPMAIRDALHEGVFDYVKTLGLAGALATAPMAGAATAESAPGFDNGKQTEITVNDTAKKAPAKKAQPAKEVRCTEQSSGGSSSSSISLPTEKEVHQFADKVADKAINGTFKAAHAGWHGLKGLISGAKKGWDIGTQHNREAHEGK